MIKKSGPGRPFLRLLFYMIRIGDNQYFLGFFKIFSIHEDVAPSGVMIRLRAADESSLSDDAVKLIIKTVIRLAHLHESIFHLLS